MRHAYLYEGLVPPISLKAARNSWGKDWKPNRRQLTRAIGLEGFGQFKPSEVPLLDGTWGTLYAFQVKDGTKQYAVLLLPSDPAPRYYYRENEKAVFNPDTELYSRVWGRWSKIDSLPDVQGCVSIHPGMTTPAQADWWKKVARTYGLDSDVQVTNRVFQVLPILRDVGGL
jgi:hypothetical protein